VTGLTYDTGALLAAEGNNRRMWAIHRRAIERSHIPTVPATVLAQGWRGGPQPLLSRLLDMCAVEPLEETSARLSGALLARAKMTDIIDAHVVVGALRRGDAIVSSDRPDIGSLAQAVGRRINIIAI
jgi:hypothetical protein